MKSSITVICGHYGCGKTNLVLNLAAEAAQRGRRSVVVDMDVVNPYFRSSDYSALLKKLGVELIAPVFANTTLDTPVLPPEIFSIFNMENADIFIDAGGDDVGATALGRFSRVVQAHSHAMLYVLNRHRNLMADPVEAVQNLREIEAATHLHVTGLVDNAHLKDETDEIALRDDDGYAETVSELSGLPLVAKTVPEGLVGDTEQVFTGTKYAPLVYPVRLHVKNPWE